MPSEDPRNSNSLVEHFFRNEYGKIVSVISNYVPLETAEDIVQETLLTAVEYWQHKGTPPNPAAWLYTTAKNKAINVLRNRTHEKAYKNQKLDDLEVSIEFSEEHIADEQLRVMTECCQPSISEETQITLILKILCGFSITEIAAAFCSTNEAINKRLVRGRNKLKRNGIPKKTPIDINQSAEVLLKTIYLLFNEGYLPARKNQIVRKDFCLEAIRLTELLISHPSLINKENTHALLALMCLNCSRFDARISEQSEMIGMELQDRTLWSQDLISKGLVHLSEAQKNQTVSTYLILASIAAHHCIAKTYKLTKWSEILALYDALLQLENSAIVNLNRLVAYSKVYGSKEAITEVLKLEELYSNYLYYATLAELYADIHENEKAIKNYKKAISTAPNTRDKAFLEKKLKTVVPIS